MAPCDNGSSSSHLNCFVKNSLCVISCVSHWELFTGIIPSHHGGDARFTKSKHLCYYTSEVVLDVRTESRKQHQVEKKTNSTFSRL